MKRFIAFAIAGVALAGCGSPGPLEDKQVGPSGAPEYRFEEAKINGRDCILLRNKTYSGLEVVTFWCESKKQG